MDCSRRVICGSSLCLRWARGGIRARVGTGKEVSNLQIGQQPGQGLEKRALSRSKGKKQLGTGVLVLFFAILDAGVRN